MSDRIFVVIPVHNRVDYTRECLEDLQIQTHPQTTVVVVDDGSTDGTTQMIRLSFPDVVVVPGDGNLWWTGATNAGVRWCLERADGDDYVLTLNNDTRLGPEFLATILWSAKEAQDALIGSVAVDSRDGATIVDGGVEVSWWTASYRAVHRGETIDAARGEIDGNYVAADVLPGRGTLIPVGVFRSIGLFNEQLLPHYGADYEFARRAVRHGYRVLVDYRSVLISEVRATGMRADLRPLSASEFIGLFTSRRSASSLRYRWNYARLCCPPPAIPLFFACDTARVVLSAVRGQMRQFAQRGT
jgi:GT2 family glycosyltransferase